MKRHVPSPLRASDFVLAKHFAARVFIGMLIMTWGSERSRHLLRLKPIDIPPTSTKCYVTGFTALNLRESGELTGDWRYQMFFYIPADQPTRVPMLAGEGGVVDSRPALGRLGVRNMGGELKRKKIIPVEQSVYFANHNRAIADLVLSGVKSQSRAILVSSSDINQWLDTKQQIADLIRNYLRPLARIMTDEERACFLPWLKTVRHQ